MSTETPTLNPSPTGPQARPPQGQNISRSELWLMRLKIAVVVIFFIEMGMVLVVIPWTWLWSDNKVLILHPGLRAFVAHGFTRGVVTGLGLINVWIGISEAVHYTEKDHN